MLSRCRTRVSHCVVRDLTSNPSLECIHAEPFKACHGILTSNAHIPVPEGTVANHKWRAINQHLLESFQKPLICQNANIGPSNSQKWSIPHRNTHLYFLFHWHLHEHTLWENCTRSQTSTMEFLNS